MANIFCSKCGVKLVENATFCSKCGAEVKRIGVPSKGTEPAADSVSAQAASAAQKARSTARIIGNMTAAPAQNGEFVLCDRSQLSLAQLAIPTPFKAAFGGIRHLDFCM